MLLTIWAPNQMDAKSNDFKLVWLPNSTFQRGWTGEVKSDLKWGLCISSPRTWNLESTDLKFQVRGLDPKPQKKIKYGPRDTKKEIWEGIRMGVEGAKSWPVTSTSSIENLEHEILAMIGNFDHVYTILGVSEEVDKISKEIDVISDPTPIIDMMRRIKSTKEIEHMQEAASIGSQAHRFAMEKAFPGMGEWEIQSAVEGFFMNA